MIRFFAFLLSLTLLFSTALAEEETENLAEQRMEEINAVLDLSQNENQAWTYQSAADAWVLSVVPYVAYPVLKDYQGFSVAVPGAYITGLDTDGDGVADVTAETADGETKGRLVINHDQSITSANGQIYTADTAPVLFETGGSGYNAQANQTAGTSYAADGIIYMSAGNRGKQSSYTDDSGATVYTGDSPDMIVDGKAAIRFLKYNISLGNLPGDADRLVVTGGSGAGAHTIMLACTGDQAVYFPYLSDLGAAGISYGEDGTLTSTVSDAVWGALGYSPITSLAEADMALAFEYTLDTTYSFNTDFQKTLAGYLSQEYMDYINAQSLSVKEEDVGFDLDGDGELASTIALTIEYDPDAHPETNGYYGTYLDLYLAQFTSSLQSYLDRLDYAEGWTWFNADGTAMSDEEVAAMTTADKAQAFIEGRVATASSSKGGMGGGPGNMGGGPGNMGGEAPSDLPDGDFSGEGPGGDISGEGPGGDFSGGPSGMNEVGTPDAGTTQSAGSGTDSANYTSYEEMLTAYQTDVTAVLAGDEYGNDQVELYDPLHWISDTGTTLPSWVRVMNGATEGDISMFNSLNIRIALLNAGVDADLEWQWNGGHVPSEVLGDSVTLRIDEMFGKYTEGAVQVEKAAAQAQTANGTAESANSTDISSWVTLDENGQASFSLSNIAAYRTSGAAKAMPAFDVIDYGQEDYVFGTSSQDARHWSKWVLKVLETYQEELTSLFNASNSAE